MFTNSRSGRIWLGIALSCPVAAHSEISTVRQQLVVQSQYSTPEAGDSFARSVATGDFDGDGFDDLAISAPGELFGGVEGAGVVTVHYGGSGGIGSRIDGFSQGAGTVPGEIDDFAFFGRALAAGDFDDDGFDDLAISGWSDIGATSQAGSVTVLYGAPDGLSDLGGAQLWTQATSGVPGSPAGQDFWGDLLAIGDFDGDDFDDLVIGAPRDDSPLADAGSVTILLGGSAGLSIAGLRYFTADVWPCSSAVVDEEFGTELAVGDFDNDDLDDLAIGVPNRDLFPGAVTVNNAGMVLIVSGATISTAGAQPSLCLWAGASLGGAAIPGVRQVSGRFGTALAAGNFNASLPSGVYADLAIGHSGALVDGVGQAGEVVLLPGSGSGLTATGAARIDSGDIPGAPPAAGSQRFGRTLHALRVTGDPSADLVVGWRPGGDDGAGVVIVPGSSGGLVLGKSLPFATSQSHLLVYPSEEFDLFGESIAVGDFDDDGFPDLAIGSEVDDLPGILDAGAALLLYGSLFSDDFETAGSRLWSSTSP